MEEILDTIRSWEKQGLDYAVATVIQTWGSAPRPVGSVMAISENLDMAGSVSGGCVEGAVVKEAKSVMESGRPKTLAFGVSNDQAWSVGLTCGGKVTVFLEPVSRQQALNQKLFSCLEGHEPCILVSHLQNEKLERSLVFPDGSQMGSTVPEEVAEEALDAYRSRKSRQAELGSGNWFIRIYPRPSRLLIIGAAHIAVDLVHLAHYFGFEPIVIDPRGIFTDRTVFSTPPKELIRDWPAEVLPNYDFDAYTYAVLLSHDPKIDDQALHLLLDSDIAYIGALGSSRTHAKRVARLQKAGFSEDAIARIHGPIGVNISARSAREIALSIIAELIKVKNGGAI
ncbi:XdhC family protein [Flavilitoribacter nigricans]|uniref:XdhC/CoxI family protein n=1 Tax=Flavilitoribacter nigricans (strain ATCC 23147 / DSM 23189 / NBRC 102662 / NCIMB 1420 / SS-2) TaxID=1122177 RepID=A0A2D0MZW2_FLAN2|nr:XdhC family protein [Flavilitoribacter nigricans]PHN01785.1 XdhC/CoxI family protein [Flavilitoribacter nigricans DSM 23189 = NBRC 102662]